MDRYTGDPNDRLVLGLDMSTATAGIGASPFSAVGMTITSLRFEEMIELQRRADDDPSPPPKPLVLRFLLQPDQARTLAADLLARALAAERLPKSR
jgi:hypothetical protein